MDPATYLEPRGPWSALLASLTSRPLQRKARLTTSTEGPSGRGHLMMRIHLISRLDTFRNPVLAQKDRGSVWCP